MTRASRSFEPHGPKTWMGGANPAMTVRQKRESISPCLDREIIGLPARGRQRKVPPLFRIVYKSSPRHQQNQLLPPPALGRRDQFRRGMRLDVGTVVAGAHVDAAFRRAKVHIGDA